MSQIRSSIVSDHFSDHFRSFFRSFQIVFPIISDRFSDHFFLCKLLNENYRKNRTLSHNKLSFHAVFLISLKQKRSENDLKTIGSDHVKNEPDPIADRFQKSEPDQIAIV